MLETDTMSCLPLWLCFFKSGLITSSTFARYKLDTELLFVMPTLLRLLTFNFFPLQFSLTMSVLSILIGYVTSWSSMERFERPPSFAVYIFWMRTIRLRDFPKELFVVSSETFLLGRVTCEVKPDEISSI